jgi:nuclear GTP-binding protein
MTTNKKKAVNFFTTANVKNRNRDRKVPKSTTGRERASDGGAKNGGKMRRK